MKSLVLIHWLSILFRRGSSPSPPSVGTGSGCGRSESHHTVSESRNEEEVRLKIAGKLVQGVTYDKILDDIRNSVSDNFKRIHLIQRKDTNNMERAFKLEGGQRHHDDATSVAAWVEEMRGMGDDNVDLYYKPQGADDYKTGLKREDFLIVLQTPIQAEIFKKFAEGKVVRVAATHGTNANSFKLVTLLVVDEYGEGFPVVCCYLGGSTAKHTVTSSVILLHNPTFNASTAIS